MRRIAGTFVTLGAAAVVVSSAMGQAPQSRRAAPAQPAAPVADRAMQAPVPDPAEMDRLLKEWAKQNGALKSLSVSFIRLDKSKVWGDTSEYEGNAFLQSPNLACLHFKKIDAKAKKSEDHERIVCTGSEVRQYDYKTQQIFVFPLDRDQRKRAIQEGPLPFLFNMNAEEAKIRWSMSLLGQDANNYLIGITPRLPTDKDVFSQAFLQLSKTTFLPNRMLLVDTNGKDTQDYSFRSVSPNAQIDQRFFQALNIKNWKVVVNPEAPQAARAGAGQRLQPAARPPVGARPAGGLTGRQPQ